MLIKNNHATFFLVTTGVHFHVSPAVVKAACLKKLPAWKVEFTGTIRKIFSVVY